MSVAPRAGAWIEIMYRKRKTWHKYVAPRAGAWIEIKHLIECFA